MVMAHLTARMKQNLRTLAQLRASGVKMNKWNYPLNYTHVGNGLYLYKEWLGEEVVA